MSSRERATRQCTLESRPYQLTLPSVPHHRIQDFKFALLDMSEERRWSHFREVQAQHGRGKANLVQNWVALLLQQQ